MTKYFKFLLIPILILGLWFRLNGVDWDAGQHLNPDERFLTMVLGNMEWPGWDRFLATSLSTFNPVNVGFKFFVYGTMPVFLNWFVGELMGKGDYGGYLLVGRILSGLFDGGTIVVTYFLGKELVKSFRHQHINTDFAGLIAAWFYAVAVIPIQNSHFFIVDTFGNFFGTLGVLIFVKLIARPSFIKGSLLGFILGMALACKLNLFLLIPAFAIGFLILLLRSLKEKQMILKILGIGIVFIASCYMTFRIAMPYAFRDYSWIKLDKTFLENMKTAGGMVKGTIDQPPSVQWAGTNFVWPIQELAVWGWSLPMGLVIALAVGWMAAKTIDSRNWVWFIVWIILLVPFAYQANLLAKAQRYFLGAYPILSLIVALFVAFNYERKSAKISLLLMGIITFGWALAFTNIYRSDHTRIEASRWIYRALPKGTKVGWEHWDDPLPLLVDGHMGGEYPGVELTLYDVEEEAKKQKLIRALVESEYIILSSNRLYGSIPKMPERYPLATKYYNLLFSEKLGFSKIAEFTSYPRLGIFKMNDDFSEELFTVYDHPKVTIFMKTSNFSEQKLQVFLSTNFNIAKTNQLPKDVKAKFVPWDLKRF